MSQASVLQSGEPPQGGKFHISMVSTKTVLLYSILTADLKLTGLNVLTIEGVIHSGMFSMNGGTEMARSLLLLYLKGSLALQIKGLKTMIRLQMRIASASAGV